MTDITATLWFLSLAAVASAETFYFNEETDSFFNELREDMKAANNSHFPLPNIRAAFTKSLLFMEFHGEMNGTAGTVGDVTTIKRTNNVTIVTAKEYYVFRVEFGFEDLTIGYKYKARFMGLPFKGDIELKIGNNAIYVEILANLTGTRCSGDVLAVRTLRFTALDKMSVKVTGFSLINRVVGYWLSHSFSPVSNGIIVPIEEALTHFFRDNLKQFDFCKYGNIPQNIPFDDMDSSGDMPTADSDASNATSKEINAVLN